MRLALVPALLLAACHGDISRDELARPYYLADYHSGLCGWVHAVDAAGEAWSKRACPDENIQLEHVRAATPAELEGLRAAFDALPAPSGETCDSGNAVAALRHLEHATAEGVRRWGLCENERDLVQEPYGTALERLNRVIGERVEP